MTESTDETLMVAVQAGNRAAAGQLFDRHYDELFAFAERLLGDPQSAADAVQDSFVRLLRYARSFRGRSSFRTWMFRVVRNACVDLIEDRRRRQRVPERIPPPDPVAPPSMPDPRIAQLRRAVDALPETRREILLLRRFHDLTYAEIGDVCGISEGAARVRAHRALAQLTRSMRATAGMTDA